MLFGVPGIILIAMIFLWTVQKCYNFSRLELENKKLWRKSDTVLTHYANRTLWNKWCIWREQTLHFASTIRIAAATVIRHAKHEVRHQLAVSQRSRTTAKIFTATTTIERISMCWSLFDPIFHTMVKSEFHSHATHTSTKPFSAIKFFRVILWRHRKYSYI